MSTLLVNEIGARTGNVVSMEPGTQLVGNVVNTAPGSIIQCVRATAMPTSHIATTTTAEASVALVGAITPKSASSVIKVDFFSTMCTGSASALITILYRRINGGAYTAVTPYTNTSARYTYGWSYDTGGWGPRQNTYFDSPGTTGLVEYVVNYRLNSGATIAYLVHQYQEYGYVLTEIAQ
jgi:hypothetical protein